MTPAPHRLGIIGCGAIGTMHAEMGRAVSIPTVGVCDVRHKKASRLAAASGNATVHPDATALLADADVTAVVVATPNDQHAGLARQVIDSGKHLLLEKPMATTVEDCIDVCQRAEARSDSPARMINFVTRRAPAAQHLKQLIDDNTFGDIYHIRGSLIRQRGIPGLGRWFTTKSRSGGGVLIDIGVHLVDLVRYLLARPAATTVTADVRGVFGSPIEKYTFEEMWAGPPQPESAGGVFDVDDSAFAFIRFDNGATFELSVTWAANLAANTIRDGLTVLGTKAACHADIWGGTITLGRPVASGQIAEEDIQTESDDPWAAAWQDQHRLFERFCTGAIADAASIPTLADGLAAQQIIDAMYRSADGGREVELGDTAPA